MPVVIIKGRPDAVTLKSVRETHEELLTGRVSVTLIEESLRPVFAERGGGYRDNRLYLHKPDYGVPLGECQIIADPGYAPKPAARYVHDPEPCGPQGFMEVSPGDKIVSCTRPEPDEYLIHIFEVQGVDSVTPYASVQVALTLHLNGRHWDREPPPETRAAIHAAREKCRRLNDRWLCYAVGHERLCIWLKGEDSAKCGDCKRWSIPVAEEQRRPGERVICSLCGGAYLLDQVNP